MTTIRRKVPGEIREVLAQNVSTLMGQRYQASSNRPLALAKDAGCSLSSVQRILTRQSGASIDTVEQLAKVFGLSTFQMLVPWGLLGDLSVRHAEGATARAPKRRPLAQGNSRHRVPVRSAARRRRSATSG